MQLRSTCPENLHNPDAYITAIRRLRPASRSGAFRVIASTRAGAGLLAPDLSDHSARESGFASRAAVIVSALSISLPTRPPPKAGPHPVHAL